MNRPIELDLSNLSTPLVMGILNVTPDSFYDGGHHNTVDLALSKAEEMISQGADIIDIGGYSSRPGAKDISAQEEIDRVVPVIESLSKEHPEITISIDTFRSKVAQFAVHSGANIINDISGGRLDPSMFATAAELHVPYILMHMRGTPQTMTQETTYSNVVDDVISELQEQASAAKQAGISSIIIDPGFGFSKTLNQNYDLLKSMEELKTLDLPLLVGVSRKSMIYKYLNITAQESLIGTSVINFQALQKGANILRVHDVEAANQVVSLFQKLNN